MSFALVVDDNRHTADALCQMLEMLGVAARPAYGPGQAMTTLKTETPDIIFLDINMPGVSGFEVLAFLRREPHLAQVPVFIVTFDEQIETAHRAMQQGALAVLIKPVMMDVLESALRKTSLL